MAPSPVALMTSVDEAYQIYSRLVAWGGDLLNVIDENSKTGPQEVLAVHASRECQPRKAPVLVEDLLKAVLNDAHRTGSGTWTVTLELPALFAPNDGYPFHLTHQATTRKQVVREVCRSVLAFMLVVQPRKVIFHPNALKYGRQSVEALIAAGGEGAAGGWSTDFGDLQACLHLRHHATRGAHCSMGVLWLGVLRQIVLQWPQPDE